MKYFLGLVLAALPALGQSGVAPLGLFTDFQPPPPPGVFDALRQEVDNIMAPLGFPLNWWSLNDRHGDQAATELAVITFRGNCSLAYLLSISSTLGPLGFTHISDGQVIPFAEVDCDRIRDYLQGNLIRANGRDRERIFGRAVGRVAAHELFHILVRTRHHGSSGVAEPAFSRGDLMSDDFHLATREFRLLRASLKPARTQNSRLRAAASPVAGRFIFQESGCASCHGPLGKGTASAPAVRGAFADAKALAARLANDFKKMSGKAKSARQAAPDLDDDEIADVLSFLNGSN